MQSLPLCKGGWGDFISDSDKNTLITAIISSTKTIKRLHSITTLELSRSQKMNEQQIETHLIEKLQTLKYSYRSDIRDNATLEHNFRQHFQALNQVQLTDKEFKRLLNQIISTDVFTNARRMREHNSMERDDGTPLFYTLINLKDWCKNTFEVVNQLRINTRDSHHREEARKIWLTDPAPVVIEKLDAAIAELRDFMELQGLDYAPKEVPNLQGDIARAQFVRLFKEVQRIKTQLDQYTDLTGEEETTIENLLPQEQLQGFKGAYLETAKRLRALQDTTEEIPPEVEQLDFEFVLFASTIVDYDYIMDLTSHYSSGSTEMTREQLIALIRSEAKFIDSSEEIISYINSLKVGEGLTKQEIFEGFARFKEEYYARELASIAEKHQLDITALRSFVNETATRFILDNDAFSQLFTPLALGWKARGKAEQDLMRDLIPLFHKITQGREISGLKIYEP